jgi:hypothetical protein
MLGIGIILNLMLLKAILELSRQITEEVEQLDTSLAGAIASVVEKFGMSGDLEQINPIQQAIAQLMTSKINQIQNPATILNRNSDGKFE